MKSKGPVFRFGDLIVNHTASDTNPHKISMVIRTKRETVLCSSSKGETWEVNRLASLEKIGTVLIKEAVAKMGATAEPNQPGK